jgi:hypothetical protein
MLMVMVLLSLMLVLAVSFTFLMSQQEGTSVASLGDEQTRIVTRTGADHAYARLNHYNRLNQHARAYGVRPRDLDIHDNPYAGWMGEVVVDLLADFEGLDGQPGLYPGLVGPDGEPLFRVEDPRSLVLGLNVEDETGKLNLNFSNVASLANMLGATFLDATAEPTGGEYNSLQLRNADFLRPYDDIGTDNVYGSGYIVVDHMLFAYESRRGNVLYNVTRNPVHQPLLGANQIFAYCDPDTILRRGSFVTTPTAYKVMLYRLLNARDGTPGMFNHTGDLRRIASMPDLFAPDARKGPVVMGERLDGWPEGIDPVTFQLIEENATTVAPTERFDGGWHYPLNVTQGRMNRQRATGLYSLLVEYNAAVGVQDDMYVQGDPRASGRGPAVAGIGPDNLVRLRSTGGEVVMGWVISGGAGGQGRGNLQLATLRTTDLDETQGWVLEVAERADVNINTAGFETLVALMLNVGPRSDREDFHPITVEQAREAAALILMRTRCTSPDSAFTDFEDFSTFMRGLAQGDGAVLTPPQVQMLLRAQMLPYAGSPMMPRVRFSPLDAYRVEALATRYQPTGGVRARSGFREHVLIGSDAEQTYRWMYWDDLAAEMRVPQGNILQLRPSGGHAGRQLGMLELPYLRYDTERYSRAWRAPPWEGPQVRNMYAMPREADRFYGEAAGVTAPTGASYQGADLQSGMFSFWYRRQWEDMSSNRYIFDVAEQEYSNRMSLLWWGDRVRGHNLARRDNALVLRIKDRTLHEAYTELHYELDDETFAHNEWYHFAVNWKGTELSHINLLIDGSATGRARNIVVQPQVYHTHRTPHGSWVSRTTRLQGGLSAPAPVPEGQEQPLEMVPIVAADIDAFPEKGVVRIGGEAIEYEGRTRNALLNARRGARGTNARAHPSDAVVSEWGYAAPVRNHLIGVPQGQDYPAWVSNFRDLPQTSGQLTSPLTTRALWRVAGEGTPGGGYWQGRHFGRDAGFPGAESEHQEYLRLVDYDGLPERGVLLVQGIAFRDWLPPGTPGSPSASDYVPNFSGGTVGPNTPYQAPQVWHVRNQYVAYDGITARGLRVVARYSNNTDEESDNFGQFSRVNPEQYWHFLAQFDETIVERPEDDELQRIWNFYALGGAVMLISIPVDDTEGYHEQSIVQVNDEWMFYNIRWQPGATPETTHEPAFAADAPFPALIYLNRGQQQSFLTASARAGIFDPQPFAPWRGGLGTEVANHHATSAVTPVFGTTVQTGEEDEVTLVIGKNSEKRQHRIRVHRELRALVDDFVYFVTDVMGADLTEEEIEELYEPYGNYGINRYICALYEHTHRTYPANLMSLNNPEYRHNPQGTNLLKFPTGEMPVDLPVNWTFNGADPRTDDAGDQPEDQEADFDSFEFRQFSRGDFRILSSLSPGNPGEGGEIRVSLPLPPNMSVIKVNNELIAYRGFEVRPLTFTDDMGNQVVSNSFYVTDITRGILGTEIGSHSAGTEIMNMASLRVGRPTEQGTPLTNNIELILGTGGRPVDYLRPYGFLRIEDQGRVEVAGYQHWGIGGIEDPDDPDSSIRTGVVNTGRYHSMYWPQALFRGAYGTRALAYSDRALFFDQPVRFPDWAPSFHQSERAGGGPWHPNQDHAIPGAPSPEITYFQGAQTFRNSIFTRFRWRMQYEPLSDLVRHGDALQARLVVRFKQPGQPLPEWDEVPTNRPGGLYSFDFRVGSPENTHLEGSRYEQTQDFTRLSPDGLGIRADRIEWRVYFMYREGAYDNSLYKATMSFQGAEVDLHQITRVVRHEQRR